MRSKAGLPTMSESFWIVETARTTYWDGRQAGRDAAFTPDINTAIKFTL